MPSKRRRATRSKFSGELGTPILWTGPSRRPQGLIEPESDYQNYLAERENEIQADFDRASSLQLRKLELLAKHYGLPTLPPPALHHPLLFAVCADLIPGFQLKARKPEWLKHATKRWRGDTYINLIADAEYIKREKKCGDSAACLQLIKHKGGRWHNKSAKTSDRKAAKVLATRLSEARNERFNWVAKLLFNPKHEARTKHLLDHLVSKHADPTLSKKQSQNSVRP